MESALITQYLGPRAWLVNHYRVYTSVPAARAYETALRVSLRDVPLVRLLFGLRGIPYRTDMTLREFLQHREVSHPRGGPAARDRVRHGAG